ncbi:hypothetical protein B0J13DRAFT_80471 [Dactylonectria estremocensis]|uniref:Uncharacterized protein n=1 Tax=Dactylonectria estremocensis TaxID=1079267 RepID=A0A9P9EHJ8_9HYPO|nr:hypothetical protein B0J13DRAFT_80471 [Dactylonectria estremocensis]
MAPTTSKAGLLLAFLQTAYGSIYLSENSTLVDKALYGDGAPYGVNSTRWPLIMADPDIEKIYPIDGYNTSMPYPGEKIDGWTVSVSVQKSIPAEGNIETSNPDGVFSLSMYRLNPPKALVQEQLSENGTYRAHNSWGLGIGFERISGVDLEILNSDDGACLKLLDGEGEHNGVIEMSGGSAFPFEVSSFATDIGWYNGSDFMSAVSNVTDAANATSVELVGNFLHRVSIYWLDWEDVVDGYVNSTVRNTTICPRSVDYTNASDVSSAVGTKPAALFSLVGLLPLALVFYLL